MSKRRQSNWTRLVLAGLLILSVALLARIHRLSVTHVGVVEYLSIVQPPGTPFIDYLVCAHEINPDHVPVYFAFVYFVRELFGYSWLTARLASMALGLLTVIFTWRFATRRYGHNVGLWAGLLIALSPAEVYHAVQPRPYALEAFFAAVSLIAIVRAMESGRRGWWVLNVAANTLMAWTHLFGVLLIAVEALWLFLLWLEKGPAPSLYQRVKQALRRLLPWCAGHVLVLVLAVAWWMRSTASQVPWFATPQPLQIFADLFGDAFLHYNVFMYENEPNPESFDLSPLAMRGPMDPWISYSTDVLLAIAILIALASIAHQVFLRRGPADGKRYPVTVLLLMAAFLPPLILNLMALVWFPMALPRYTSYTNLAFFIVLAIGASGLKVNWARAALALTLCACLAVECMYWSRGLITNDWAGLVRLLDWQGNPPQRVVCLKLKETGGERSFIVRRMLRRSDPTHPNRYLAAYTVDGAVDACVATHQIQKNEQAVSLITYEHMAHPAQAARLAKAVEAAGFRVKSQSRLRFTVYSLRPDHPAETWKQPANDTAQRYREVLKPYLPADVGEEELNAALRWAVATGDDLEDERFMESVPLALLEISPKTALAAIRLIPDSDTSPEASLARILCELGNGSNDDLSIHVERINKSHRIAFARPLVAALAAHDWEQARELVKRLRVTDGVLLPPVVYQMVGIEQRLPWAAPLQLPPARDGGRAALRSTWALRHPWPGEDKGALGSTTTR